MITEKDIGTAKGIRIEYQSYLQQNIDPTLENVVDFLILKIAILQNKILDLESKIQ